MGEVRIGQGRDAAKQYLRDNPEVAEKLDADIRRDFYKLMSNQSKACLLYTSITESRTVARKVKKALPI